MLPSPLLECTRQVPFGLAKLSPSCLQRERYFSRCGAKRERKSENDFRYPFPLKAAVPQNEVPRSPRFLLPMSSGLPVWHFLRRLSSSAVSKVSAVESSTLSANTWSNHFRPRRFRPSRARASFNFSSNTAMSAGSWDETGGVLAAGGVQYAGDGNISLDIRLSTPFFPPLGPRTSLRGVASPSLLPN